MTRTVSEKGLNGNTLCPTLDTTQGIRRGIIVLQADQWLTKQTNKHIKTKGAQNCPTSITYLLIVGREQRHSGGNESVWDLGCVYNHPGLGWLARVHAAVTGSEVSGSRVFLKKICEAELKWSTSGRRTMRASGLWNRGEEQYSGQGEEELRGGGTEEGARGGKRRRRIMCNECVPPSELLWNVTKWPTFCEAGPWLEGSLEPSEQREKPKLTEALQ